MKKKFVFLFLFVNFTVSLFAADYVGSANRSTAVRCLKLAENCLLEKNWDGALAQAELGLTYDEQISDLLYIKAVAQLNLNQTKCLVLKTIAEAFEIDDWVSYTKSRARIFYADLLSDTDNYELSLKILDEDPFLYSADAEFIRIKNYYRMGTEESWNKARTKVDGARRVYANDVRFPQIFFLFECTKKMRMERTGVDYIVPAAVQRIADTYIDKLPDNSMLTLDDKIFASYFAEPELQYRLISAIEARTHEKNALLAIAGLYTGLYSEQQACDLFFETVGESMSVNLLDFLIYAIKDYSTKQDVVEKMLNYNGIIQIDTDFDFQYEANVKYELGRPQSVTYDFNNDGEKEIYASCDFGSPTYLYFESSKIELLYDNYPNVRTVLMKDTNYMYHFLYRDYSFVPFTFVPDSYLLENDAEFLIPVFSADFKSPVEDDFYRFASKLEYPTFERTDSKVVYSTRDGALLFAEFFENDNLYANCTFDNGKSFARFVDYDDDGYFETTEIYDSFMADGFDSRRNDGLISTIFGESVKSFDLYLKQVLIDRNGNTFYEFTEEYLEDDGRIDCWDYDDNGIIDCQNIIYPHKKDESLVEETVFYGDNGLAQISLYCIDSIPIKMNYHDREVMIFAGDQENFYWIENEGSFVIEDAVIRMVGNNMQQGLSQILQFGEDRISVIRIGSNLFAKILPQSYVEIEE